MFMKNANKMILALLLVIFALNASLAGNFKPLNHVSETDLEGVTIWVHNNDTTPFSILFTNNASSVNNVTKINFGTSNTGVLLSGIICPAGWYDNSSSGTDILCLSNTSVLQPGQSIQVNATIQSANVSLNTITVWDWETRDDSVSTPVKDDGTFMLNIDVNGTTDSFTDSTSVIGNGNHTVSVAIVESEVQVDNSSSAIADHVELAGVCKNTTLYSPPTLICSADQKNCNYSFVIDATKNNITVDGDCNITVMFNDTFGNQGSGTKTYQIDNTGPIITLISHTNGSEIKAGDIVQFNITDSPAGLNFTNWTWGAFNSSADPIYSIDTTGMPDGELSIGVWANDSLGNIATTIHLGGTNDTFDNVTVIVDNTEPTVEIHSPVSGYYGDSIFVNVTAIDLNTVSFVQARWKNSTDNGTWINLTDDGNFWTGTIDSSLLAETNYTVMINAVDEAGNSNNTQTVVNIGIDHTDPILVSILAPSSGDSVEAGTLFTVTASVNDSESGADYCSVLVDGATTIIPYDANTSQCSGSVTAPGTEANHPVYVTVYDKAGNTDTAATDINVFVVSSPGGGGGSFGPSSLVPLEIPGENNKPELTAPKIDNESPVVGEVITCISGTFSDADGDSKVGERFKWFVNSKEVQMGAKDTFDTKNTEAGDVITCSQRATDGIDYSEWADSSNSAEVQEPEQQMPAENQVAAEDKTVSNPFTGAFIGGLLGDNVAVTVLLVTIFGGALAVFTIRLIKRRKIQFKLN